MALRDASKAWSTAAQAKDPGKFASFYTEDAVLMLPDAPEMSGKAAIREAITMFMKDPNFALSFETKSVEVARSGDLAYELSTQHRYVNRREDKETRYDERTRRSRVEEAGGWKLEDSRRCAGERTGVTSGCPAAKK